MSFFLESNVDEYSHHNFTWQDLHFLFGSVDPRCRAVTIHTKYQENELFPDRRRVVVYQWRSNNQDWHPGVLKFPQIEVSGEFEDLLSLINLGAVIAKNADSFFANPLNWLERKAN